MNRNEAPPVRDTDGLLTCLNFNGLCEPWEEHLARSDRAINAAESEVLTILGIQAREEEQ